MIKINNLTKIYLDEKKQHVVLKDLSLDVEQGEILALMGPSGVGKTTVLNIIAGLDTDFTGNVTVSDHELKSLSRPELNEYRNSVIGFIFQEFNLLPHLSALENVLIPLMFSGIGHHKAKQLGMDALKTVGLEEYVGRMPSELSGGQKQRVAVARALINKPKIILADEPTANLDAETEKSVLDLILKLAREESVTLVISTHRKDIASLAEKTVVLNNNSNKIGK